MPDVREGEDHVKLSDKLDRCSVKDEDRQNDVR
jgi:hypothetical protein